MGRPLRCHRPGTYHLLTSRCQQARFFFRPDARINRAVLVWLARAQERWPGVRVFAICVMSNHLHVLVEDVAGDLAAWSAYVLGNLARSVNRIRGREGQVFARRYSAEPVLDTEALLDRFAYIVCNPVQAGLCARAADWPGINLWSRSGQIERWVTKRGVFAIYPLPGMGSRGVTEVRERERGLGEARARAGLGVLGVARILAQRWQDRPTRPKRSPRPMCHAADRALREAFAEAHRAFVAAFREASARLREGFAGAVFPPWSYPPGRPLVRTGATA